MAQIWNKALETPESRELVPRQHVWASELGKPHIDVMLAMQAEEPTNPPNPRSLRKFEAGNLWEWIFKIVLIRAGILVSSQERIEVELPGMLKVTGKVDYVAGGNPNYELAKSELGSLDLPPRTTQALSQLMDYFSREYPNGLKKQTIEIKSVSSHVMNVLEQTQKPISSHALQAYHYTFHNEIDSTLLVYISRDDCRMIEFVIPHDNSVYSEPYYTKLAELTKVFNSGELPAPAEPIVFDEELGKFALNRQIAWSQYLTKVYGYEDQAEFENKFKSVPAAWNRVLTRIKNRQTITAKNQQYIDEMAEQGFDAVTLAGELVDLPEEGNEE